LIGADEIRRIILYLEGSLSRERFIHSENVAMESARIAEIYGVDRDCSYNSGFFHDIARELSTEQMLYFAKKYKNDIAKWEEDNPIFLHGAAGAYMLKNLFAVENQKLLEAVEYHTFGVPHLCDVAKVVYIADVIAPGRDFDASALRVAVGRVSLDQLLFDVAIDSIRFDKSLNRDSAPPLIEMVNWLRDKKSVEERVSEKG